MRSLRWCRWLLVGGIMTSWLLAVAGSAGAVEETQRFLDALRQRGLFDMAEAYLEQMRDSRLVGDEFRKAIEYETAVTLIARSQTTREPSERRERLDKAREHLKTYLVENPESADAKMQLANVLVERGRVQVGEADKDGVAPEEKQQLQEHARTLYQQAGEIFGELEQHFLKQLQKFPKGFIDPKDTATIEARAEVRKDLLRARLVLAQLAEEAAMTYTPDSQDRVAALQAAADKYHELYAKYNAYIGGLYARMWEGRCYRELGQRDKTFEALKELLAQPDEPREFRDLKNKALALFLETALMPEEKRYQEAVTEAQKWQRSAGGDESSPDGLAIKFLAAEAELAYAEALTNRRDERQRKKLRSDAEKLFEDVAGFSGPYQIRAKEALRRPVFVGDDYVEPEPTTFVEARQRAKEALSRSRSTELSEDEAAEARQEAIRYYRMALGMRADDVTVEDLNVIRYYLAYLYLMTDRLYDAAVLGEFLGRRYPEGMMGREGAKFALAAYGRLYNAARADDRQFETDHMIGVAQYITQKWQDKPEADDAWMMLVQCALSAGELDKARQYLEQVSPDLPRRGKIELYAGRKLWAAYLEASREPEDQRPQQAELQRMVQQAQEMLESGIARARKSVDHSSQVTDTLAGSVLSLAQIQIGAGEAGQGMVWLEEPTIGPLALIESDHPAAGSASFRIETYKAALRAYVATGQLDKAEAVMKVLEDLIGQSNDPDAGSQLTRIYISLGRELEDQLARLRNEQKLEQLENVSRGFERFLDRISQRRQGNTFHSLNWVAETFFGLGAGFDPGGTTLTAEAKDYYSKAAETYRNILTLCNQNKLDVEPNAVVSVKIRLAKCLRRLGQYNEALGLLLSVLKQHNAWIDAQMEAAYTYQARGEVTPGYFQFAIKGSTKYKEIWGWGRIARVVAPRPEYRSIFHEARYNLALCHFRWATKKTGKAKQDMLHQAERDVLNTQRLYPKMGGNQWYPKYDDLLKKIQRVRGLTPGGLKAASARMKRLR